MEMVSWSRPRFVTPVVRTFVLCVRTRVYVRVRAVRGAVSCRYTVCQSVCAAYWPPPAVTQTRCAYSQFTDYWSTVL